MLNTYNTPQRRERKKRRTWVGCIWCHNKSLSGLADPFAIVITAKCPRLRCRMREQAAVFSCECLGEWLIRETFKKAVGCSSYMYSDAKVLIFLDIPILFAIYLTDSYQFQGLKGSTSCYFMRILCSIHPHTPFLSPSPARGMFRFCDMVSDVSFLYHTP